MPLKVMVVDDDVSTLELMSEVFRSLGVDVRPVSNSQDAVRLIQGEKFDGIFLDLMMPNLDGFELAREVRRSSWNRRTPIVIVTGRDFKETRAEVFDLGATFFLQKPIDRTRLTTLLNSTRGAMLEERRRFRRIPLRTEVTWQAGSRKATGMSSNLSQEGILFQADGELEVGSRVRLWFRLPQQAPVIEVEADVVRIDEKERAGVRFAQLSSEDRQRVRELIISQDRP